MINNKNILVFHHSGAIGGGGVSMLHILGAIKELGCNIKVICPKEPSYMMDEIEKLGIQAEGIFDKGWVYPHFNGQTYSMLDPRFIKQARHIQKSKQNIKKIIDSNNPDIVILNSMTIGWMIDIIDQKIKTICFDRETLPNDGRDIRSKKIIKWLSHMTKSVFLSEYDKNMTSNKDNALVITDKVDVNAFKNMPDRNTAVKHLGLDEDKKYILFTGGMWQVKGSHTALEMMRHLNPNYNLLFMQYTNGGLTGGMRAKIKRALGLDYEKNTLRLLKGIENRVHFFAPQDDIVPFYAACDVVIFPSTKPHQSRPVYEAGAAQKPIVISDFKNTHEFAIDNVNALTFKQTDAKDLAQCIIKLEDDTLYKKLCKNGYDMSIKNHNIEKLKDEIQTLIKDIEDITLE